MNTTFQMGRFCYVCLQSNELLITPNAEEEDNKTIMDKLIDCVPEIIWSQDSKSLICWSCRNKLGISYNFRKICLKSNQFIQENSLHLREKNCIDHHKIKTEIDETSQPDSFEPILSNTSHFVDFSLKPIKTEVEDLDSVVKTEAVNNSNVEKEELTHREKETMDIRKFDTPKLYIDNEEHKNVESRDNYKEESEVMCTPEIIDTQGGETTANLLPELPEKSSERYKVVYNEFINWQTLKQIESFSENVLLEYFEELSQKYKSSSLWSRYSMLRSTISLNHNINIEFYSKLREFLKRNGENYTARKTNTLSADQIKRFIREAPDITYLATKVALIMGVMGACRKTELYSMKREDVRELGTALLVIIPNTKTKDVRKFTIINEYYDICKKYINLRPLECGTSAFFLNYHKGKCTTQRIGINKFSNMGKQIAEYLKLPNSNLYTGHCFRRSSATLSVDSSGEITSLKRPRFRLRP